MDLNLSDFHKIQRKHETDGYAEGLSDGRDSVFQSGFDAGYKEGFETAFQLGQKQHPSATKGFCVICQNQELIKANLQEVVEAQKTKKLVGN